AEFESEKSDHKQKTPKTGIKKQTIPRGRKTGSPPPRWPKNNKQKPPNTLLSSQTTGFSALSPFFGATSPA
ncbi:hypothetical protein VXE65_30015, partial [Mycolicibacterium conceptionense]|uniref:hypothetical protein n=1 Tax=Mycolicibacterium conceptionense TaxID=451644 RepID=UPI003204F130